MGDRHTMGGCKTTESSESLYWGAVRIITGALKIVMGAVRVVMWGCDITGL